MSTTTAPVALDDKVPVEKDRMRVGEALDWDTSLVSPNGKYKLVLQEDGNLVLYKTMKGETRALWDTGTSGRKRICIARLENDGRIYLRDVWGNDHGYVVKSDEVNGRRGYGKSINNASNLELRVHDDGNMAVYANGVMAWDTKTTQPNEHFAPTGNRMVCGNYIDVGEQLVSPNNRNSLTVHDDGNFVLYKTYEGKKLSAWSSGTGGLAWSETKPFRASLEEDGNLVVFDRRNTSKWQSGTSAKNTVLIVRDDGNAVITSGDTVIWSTETLNRSQPDSLKFGEVCMPGESIVSVNGKYCLAYQEDRNLVLYGEQKDVKWALGSNGEHTGLMLIDENGKLTIFNAWKNVVWQCDHNFVVEKGSAVLKVRDDGHIVILDKAGTVVWCPTMDIKAPQPCTRLLPKQYITLGQKLTSPTGNYSLGFTSYGYFSLEHKSGDTVWTPQFTDASASTLTMQGDGNLVLKGTRDEVLWSTGTKGSDNSLKLEDNGNLKVLNENKELVWELGILDPTLNGPTDRLTSGQHFLKANPLVSKSGRYKLSYNIDEIITVRGNEDEVITESMLILEDVQEKKKYYYFVGDATRQSTVDYLRLSKSGSIEIIEMGIGNSVAFSSADTIYQQPGIPRREDHWHEMILQDDGNLVVIGVTDILRDEKNYAPWEEERRFQRATIWELSKIPSYPSLRWPGRSRLLVGEKLLSGQSISTPDGSTTMTLGEDGNLVIYDRHQRPVWASNTHQGFIRGNAVDHLIMEADGNLVLYTEGSVEGKPYKNANWRSGKEPAKNQNDWRYCQLEPGRAVIYVSDKETWNSSKTGWVRR